MEYIMDGYAEYLNPALAKLLRFMGLAVVEESAAGVFVYDREGNAYLDCLGGYGSLNLGHRHPRVIAAVEDQLHKMPFSSKILCNAVQVRLAEKLAGLAPGGLQYSFFTNSGAEAVEGAIKLARLATKRTEIVAAKNSFHGKTLGALSATGRAVFTAPCQPLLPGFSHVSFGDLPELEQAMTENTAAVILEPIQGEGGIILPPLGYLKEVRKLCDANGSLLILDEVQTGFGRTGTLFACEQEEVVPDILTLAKALGGGVMPIGAFMATASVWQPLIENPFLHTSTFGGNPLACRAGLAMLTVLEEEALLEHTRKMGEFLLTALRKRQKKYAATLLDVRGRGLLIGLEFCEEGIAGLVMHELIAKQVLVAYTLNQPKVIRLEPPLIIQQEEINMFLQALDQALAVADAFLKEMTACPV